MAFKLTPIADPARISVNSQVARLTSGKLAPAKFDYQFLRFDAGHYGRQALAALTHSRNVDVASRARLALAEKSRVYFNTNGTPDPAATEPPLAHAAIYPKGAVLPDGFGKSGWSDDTSVPDCLKNGSPCNIIILPRSDANGPLLLVMAGPDTGDAPKGVVSGVGRSAPVLGRDADGKWGEVGHLALTGCPSVREALRRGDATPVHPLHDDVIANGLRLTFSPISGEACPALAVHRPQ